MARRADRAGDDGECNQRASGARSLSGSAVGGAIVFGIACIDRLFRRCRARLSGMAATAATPERCRSACRPITAGVQPLESFMRAIARRTCRLLDGDGAAVLLKDGDELWRWSEDGARKIYSHVVRRALPTAQSHVTACFFGGGHCVRAARGRPVRLLCALHREAVRVGHSVRCKDGMSSLAGPAWVWLGCGERAG